MIAADPAKIRAWLDAVIPDNAKGWLHGARGIDGHFNGSGKYEFAKGNWRQWSYHWPTEAGDAVKFMAAHAPDDDVYCCAYLQQTGDTIGGRTKANAVSRQLAHSDVDGGLDLYDEVIEQGNGIVTASGTADHTQVFIQLADDPPEEQHDALEEALAKRFGGDSKVRSNDVLRPAGTINHKGRARGKSSTLVDFIREPKPNARKLKARELAGMLGLNEVATVNGKPDRNSEIPRNGRPEPVDLTAYLSVRAALKVDSGDRSEDTVAVTRECYDTGLSLGQARAVVNSRSDLAERVDEFLRRIPPVDDVRIIWEKTEQEWPHPEIRIAAITADAIARMKAASPHSLLDSLSVDGEWLDGQKFSDLEYAVDGILTEGAGLLVGPPKKGKSFLVADFGLAVAAGRKALGVIPVAARPVLYLALEDGHRRLQNRFRQILVGGQIPKGIKLITKAKPEDAVLAIEQFITRHAAAKPLVILDTLGKVKPSKKRDQDAYQADYAFGSLLKGLVDAAPGATLLIVHHTRKAEASDFVDSVSGTNGVAGPMDFVLVLDRKRLSNDAILSVTGRDILEAEYALTAVDGILWRLDGADLKAAADTVGKRRTIEKLGDRSTEVFRFVEKAPGAVTATDVAKALDGMDGNLAGQYLRRLADQGLILKLSRGQFMPAAPTP